MGNNLFYTVMRVKGRYYLYKVIYVNGRKRFVYVGPCEKLESSGGPAGIRTQDLRRVRAAS